MKLKKVEDQRQAVQQHFFGDQNQPLNSNSIHQELHLQKSNSKMQHEFLMKAYSNWRPIVEEMVLTTARLQKIIEVSQVMESWLKTKIRKQRGLFSFALTQQTRELGEISKPKFEDQRQRTSAITDQDGLNNSSEKISADFDIPLKLETREEHDLLMLRLNILSCVFSSSLPLSDKLTVAFDYLMIIYEEEYNQLDEFERTFSKENSGQFL